LEELIKTLGIQDVVIALSHLNQHKMMRLTEICEKTVETTRIVPPIGAFFTMGVEIEILGNVLSLSVERNLIKPWNILLKRLLDFGMAFFLSILFLPIALALAVAIKIDSLGGVIFSQERLGRGSRVFKAFKFRSMYTDGDAKLHDYLKQNPHLRDEWQTYQKLKTYDPRVTKIGKLIRKYSVDEIPQILNVLKGEMSIVGPRPYLPRERDKIGKSSTIISRVRPGMTGLWQVSGRNLLSFKDRLLLDEYYIRNWSFWLDVVILLKTVKVLAKREGAY
jgi:undecaprenyl-phosphate galactose phosphotransferase